MKNDAHRSSISLPVIIYCDLCYTECIRIRVTQLKKANNIYRRKKSPTN